MKRNWNLLKLLIFSKSEVEIFNRNGTFRYRMEIESLPRKGDKILLDGFWYEVVEVAHSDNDVPRVRVSEELDTPSEEFYSI